MSIYIYPMPNAQDAQCQFQFSQQYQCLAIAAAQKSVRREQRAELRHRSHSGQGHREPRTDCQASGFWLLAFGSLNCNWLRRLQHAALSRGQGQATTSQGAAGKITTSRRAAAPARQNKLRTCVLFFSFYFLVRVWAFLGKGSSKTREFLEKKCVSKKIHWGFIFQVGFFSRVDYLLFFFRFFLLRWLSTSNALAKRLR
jgi:hypothetical protein